MARKRTNAQEISQRKALFYDVFFLYRLRNRKESYKYFRMNQPVKLLDHLLWFSRLLSPQSNKTLYIVFYKGKKVGQIRFDVISPHSSEISISILKEYMGKGIMSKAFDTAMLDYAEHHRAILKIYAFIHPENKDSISFFSSKKFKKEGKRKGNRYTELMYAIKSPAT